MKPISAGTLKHRISIQQRTDARNAIGDAVTTWGDIATRIHADVQPLRGREFIAAAQVQAAMDMRVIIHRRAGLTREMRLVWHSTEGDVPLDIISIAPVGKHSHHLEIMASSGIRNAQ